MDDLFLFCSTHFSRSRPRKTKQEKEVSVLSKDFCSGQLDMKTESGLLQCKQHFMFLVFGFLLEPGPLPRHSLTESVILLLNQIEVRTRFSKAVTWICKSYYIYFCCPLPNQTKSKFDQDF